MLQFVVVVPSCGVEVRVEQGKMELHWSCCFKCGAGQAGRSDLQNNCHIWKLYYLWSPTHSNCMVPLRAKYLSSICSVILSDL